VAESGDQVVGVANLGVLEGVPVMWKLYVHPDHHGDGIGSGLLARVEQSAEVALALEYLDGNSPAAGFYRSHGFAESHRSVFDGFPDLTWVWMSKDLP
jgi:GNAT superfamily N-acetyltransferase